MSGTNSKAARTAAARERMVRAALELIGEGGLSYATLARIGERAGYSRGLADYHFADKTAIVSEVVRLVVSEWSLAREPVERQRLRGLEALRTEIGAYFQRLTTNPLKSRVLLILTVDAMTVEPEIAEILAAHDRGYRRTFARWIRQAKDDADLPAGLDADAAATLVQGALRGVAYQWVLAPDAFDPLGMVELVSGVLAGGLGAVDLTADAGR